jgi:Fe-S cluster assembly protein SufD
LLSETAEIDTKPQLEILTDDIKCVHGATVGQLDEAALFYLRSRGLDLETARQVLTEAFFSDVIHRIPHPALREQVKQCL